MRSIFSCRDNSFRASLAVDERLTRGGHILLFVHQMMCTGCRAYARQIRGLASLIRRRRARDASTSGGAQALSPQARERITRSLREQQG